MSAPQFRVLVTFRHPGWQTVYVKGMIYSANNPTLITLAEQWLAEGKVEWVDRSKAKMQGQALVKEGGT